MWHCDLWGESMVRDETSDKADDSDELIETDLKNRYSYPNRF